jgi:lipid-binding SYLF domain-containing protein
MKKTKRAQNGLLFEAFLMGLLFLLMTGSVSSSVAAEAVDQQGLVDKARITFESFMADENMDWFRENLYKAKGLLIVPELLKGGFIVGGSGGSGVLIVKDKDKHDWSQPAFYTIGSGSIGFQIGAEKSEIIMMVWTDRGLDSLYSSSFKLGGDCSVAAGPVGGGAKSNVMADIISFVRSKGIFGGVSLEGAVIKTKDEWNEKYYEKKVRPIDIIVKRTVSNAGSAQLRQAVGRAVK